MHGELPGWGTAAWGLGSLGLLPTTGGPLVIYQYPANNQLDIPENTPITVQFFDPTYDLNTTSVVVTIDGVIAYSGVTGFSAGYVGRVSTFAGILIVRIQPLTGFEFEKTVNVSAYAEDLTDLHVTSNWSFKVRANPICYTGLQPLNIEQLLQRPFGIILGLEQYRILFIDNALRSGVRAIENRGNKAARVIYKLAYATELRTLQNKYALYNAEALDTVVCENQGALNLDRLLLATSKTLKSDIQSFHKLCGLDIAYLKVFNEYLDSTLYTYRVSLLANILLYAKAYELEQGYDDAR